MRGEIGSKSSDMFAFGVILLFLHFPNLKAVKRREEEEDCSVALEIPKHSDQRLCDLLRCLLHREAKKRASANSCFSHPFFSSQMDKNDEIVVDILTPPIYWRSTDDLCMNIIQLEDIAPFQDLIDKTEKEMKVTRVERIENGRMWKKFVSVRSCFLSKYSQSIIKQHEIKTSRDWMQVHPRINECFLFHSIEQHHLTSLFTHGFDERETRNGMFGNGKSRFTTR